MARPPADIDIKKLKALMRWKPSLLDTAAFFECNPSTIERFILKHFQIKFAEFREQQMVHTRMKLSLKAIEKAEAGDNTMLIFCLKNLCDWADKGDQVVINNVPAPKVTEADVKDRIEKKKAK